MRGPETEKLYQRWMRDNLFKKYLPGKGLDIGYKGDNKHAQPILAGAIGIDRDYPGYDGRTLPFADESQDFVFSSHCLEHIAKACDAITEWFRVIKPGGYLVLYLPHQYLYERKYELPSKWNGDHKWFITPSYLLTKIEFSLIPNSYQLIHCKDCREGYDYNIPLDKHPCGEYSIECVIRKIQPPTWEIK